MTDASAGRVLHFLFIGKGTDVDRAIVSQLRRNHIQFSYLCIAKEANRHIARQARTTVVVQRGNIPDAVDKLMESSPVDGIISWDEGIMQQLARTEFARSLLASGPETFALIADKSQQLAIARSIGMDVLETNSFCEEELPNLPDRIDYPAVCRPSGDNGGGCVPRFKYRLLTDRSDAEKFVREVISLDGPLVVQPFVRVPSMVVHAARDREGRVAYAQFLAPYKIAGVALAIMRHEEDPRLRAHVERYLETIGLLGVCHFDFLYDEAAGKNYFLEINPRFGGTTPKIDKLGWAEVDWLLACFGFPCGGGISASGRSERRISVPWRAVVRAGMSILQGKVSPVDYPFENRYRDLIRLSRLATWRIVDHGTAAFRRPSIARATFENNDSN